MSKGMDTKPVELTNMTEPTENKELSFNKRRSVQKTNRVRKLDRYQSSNISKVNYSQNLIANIRTTFILFVTALMMAIFYTPALLTSLGFISYNPVHWNIIYLNNAANPIIYSFMNPQFRKAMKKYYNSCFR